MGCDGGTIPRRDELVRTKKKPEQKDKNAENVAKWKHCALTQEPLRKPIISCELGKFYNKEAVIEHVLNKDKALSHVASHITKMSDVKELNLTEKKEFEANKQLKGDQYVDFNDSLYICPVTSIDMNGNSRFFMIWSCGCVISERAIKEVKSETCHKCGKPFTENNMIILNGDDEETKVLEERMIERRRLAKLEKKRTRSAATVVSETSGEKKIKLDPQPSTSATCKEKEVKVEDLPSTSETVSNGFKVPSQQNGHQKSSKLKPSATGVDLPKKATNSYSIAKDPNASKAYKSLFTTSDKAKNQVKPHWITHNPCYY